MQIINKLKNHRQLTRSLIIGAVAILSLSIGAVASYQYAASQNARVQELNTATEEMHIKEDADKDSDKKKADQKEDPEANQDEDRTDGSDSSTTNTKTIRFTKGGGHADNQTVSVSQSTSSPQTGTCTYIFTLGNSRVEKSNTIHSSNQCRIDVPISAFPKSGEWTFNLEFNSRDGNVYGTGGGFSVTVDPQPRTISFRKGGAGQSGDAVNVSGTMSEAHSGTCTYTFSLNGSVRVKETTKIYNSKTCSTSIATKRFRKSATYSFRLSFESSDGKVVAKQSPIDVEVK